MRISRPHRVAVLAYEGMGPFEFGVVVEVFGLPRPELDVPWWYTLEVCSATPGKPMRAMGGFTMTTEHGLDRFAHADTVIIPGAPVTGEPSLELAEALRSVRGRLVSICSGAFSLAGAGLLDGRKATTHWRYADRLAARYPRVSVDPNVLYVEDGNIVTGAGSAAGLDVCLHLVRSDHGAKVANTVARRLVIAPHRAGGQAQFIQTPIVSTESSDPIADSMQWALSQLASPLTLTDLARAAHLAPRTYQRKFTSRMGVPPMRWVISQRIAASLALLETPDLPVEKVAEAVGFESPVTFRHHFTKAMRTSPSSYRRAFTATP
ncbi:transcriptional regulator FtrA [Rhizocola hellebori]|uniref:Transcriptional regulator FtrA n=1 Tax=Rhizocola hellebori TaxID=1392758 RepID=A0A8J3Q8Y2_9ACTN|nr:helix-turn-helix domain-containing protein [Rhizocola hellebori]GIH06090.1 transcriptional regulator FtrA [Rhizocola hellebori]